MEEAEFDRFADDYRSMHMSSIKASGESPEFFARYKVRDTARIASCALGRLDLRILDFGSGVGNSIPWFREFFPAATLTCADVSPRSLEISASRFPGLAEHALIPGDRLPFGDGVFDLVFSACVFHHIPGFRHERLLGEFSRVLAAGGLVIVFEHNPRNPLTVRAVKSCPFDADATLIDSAVLKSSLARAGFRRLTTNYRIFFPRLLAALRPLESLLAGLPLGAQYFVAGRNDGGR